MNATYTIPEKNREALIERLAKLNKAAAKLGVAPATWTFGHSHWDLLVGDGEKSFWYHEDEVPAHYKPLGARREWLTLDLTAETPKLAGWSLVAVLEALEGGNLVKEVPGETCPDEYRTRLGDCDHCHKSRRRTETFVVRHESGEYKVVGRNCLKDFLGHANPHALAGYAELLFALDAEARETHDEESWGSWAPRSYDLIVTLATVNAVVRRYGWKPKSACEFGGASTASLATTILAGRDKWAAEVRSEVGEPTDADRAKAEAAVAWARGLDTTGNSYLHNVKLLASVDYCTLDKMGFVASIPAAYDRARGEEIERKAKAERKPSEHFGEAGKRAEYVVTVERVIPTEGNYGTTYITKLLANGKDRAVWFASSEHDLEEGHEYRVKATVKRHSEWNGLKETTLTRVAVVEEITRESTVAA